VIGVIFEKARAEHFLDGLLHDKPIQPPANGWTFADMLALAGACQFVVFAHGPADHQTPIRHASQLPLERKEALDSTLLQKIHAATDFYASLTTLVQDDEYDAAGYASRCTGAIGIDAQGNRWLEPGEGMPTEVVKH
jgi:hypothetical protein